MDPRPAISESEHAIHRAFDGLTTEVGSFTPLAIVAQSRTDIDSFWLYNPGPEEVLHLLRMLWFWGRPVQMENGQQAVISPHPANPSQDRSGDQFQYHPGHMDVSREPLGPTADRCVEQFFEEMAVLGDHWRYAIAWQVSPDGPRYMRYANFSELEAMRLFAFRLTWEITFELTEA